MNTDAAKTPEDPQAHSSQGHNYCRHSAGGPRIQGLQKWCLDIFSLHNGGMFCNFLPFEQYSIC